jgi:hypothetical protein
LPCFAHDVSPHAEREKELVQALKWKRYRTAEHGYDDFEIQVPLTLAWLDAQSLVDPRRVKIRPPCVQYFLLQRKPASVVTNGFDDMGLKPVISQL